MNDNVIGIAVLAWIPTISLLFVVIYYGNRLDEQITWFSKKSENIPWIKKYISELSEELKLYWEAMELQKKINKFKQNN